MEISLKILKRPRAIITPTPAEIIATINQEFRDSASETSLERIIKSGSAIDIINPRKSPNISTLLILSNLPKKSPIIVPILEIERSMPDRNIESPRITPNDPKINLISR